MSSLAVESLHLTAALAVVLRVHRARRSKRQQNYDRARCDPQRRRRIESTVRPSATTTLRVSGCQPIDVAADGTCHKNDVFGLINEMSKAERGSVAALVELCQDLHYRVVQNRINAEFVAGRLHQLAGSGDLC